MDGKSDKNSADLPLVSLSLDYRFMSQRCALET
jgi:hypothetical protein